MGPITGACLLAACVYIFILNRRQSRMQDRYHENVNRLITTLESHRGHTPEEESAAREERRSLAQRVSELGLGEWVDEEERRQDPDVVN